MKRYALIVSAALAVGTLGVSSFAADDTGNMGNTANNAENKASSTGDSVRNSADHATAGTPTADNPVPDAKDIRKAIASTTNDALTKGNMSSLVDDFVDADQNRIKQSPTEGDNFGDTIDGRIEQISQAWKAKYGHDFDIKKNVDEVFSSDFATLQQGVIGNGNDAQLTEEVMKNSSDRNMTDDKNNVGNKKSDENLENGRSIAVVTIAASHGLGEVKVPLIHQLPDSWKINVPDSLDANKLRDNLKNELTAIGSMSSEWPSDENEAYRAVAHHIMMAVLDIPESK